MFGPSPVFEDRLIKVVQHSVLAFGISHGHDQGALIWGMMRIEGYVSTALGASWVKTSLSID